MIECKVILETTGEPAADVPTIFVAVPMAGSYIRAGSDRFKVAWVEHGQVENPAAPIPDVLLKMLPDIAAIGAKPGRAPADQAMINDGLDSIGNLIARRSQAVVPCCTLYVTAVRAANDRQGEPIHGKLLREQMEVDDALVEWLETMLAAHPGKQVTLVHVDADGNRTPLDHVDRSGDLEEANPDDLAHQSLRLARKDAAARGDTITDPTTSEWHEYAVGILGNYFSFTADGDCAGPAPKVAAAEGAPAEVANALKAITSFLKENSAAGQEIHVVKVGAPGALVVPLPDCSFIVGQSYSGAAAQAVYMARCDAEQRGGRHTYGVMLDGVLSTPILVDGTAVRAGLL